MSNIKVAIKREQMKARFQSAEHEQARQNVKIIRGVFDTKLELEHAGVAAGFPSPADEYRHETLDFRSISKTKPRVRHLINVKKPHFLHFDA